MGNETNIYVLVDYQDLIRILILANKASNMATDKDGHAYTRLYQAIRRDTGINDKKLYPILMSMPLDMLNSKEEA